MFNTIIERKPVNVYLNIQEIDGKMIKIFFKELKLIKGIKRELNLGKIEGYIDIVYPVAGLDINLELEIHTFLNKDGEMDGFFKIPFADEKTCLYDIEYEIYHTFNYEEDMEERVYNECSCGGEIVPMYEEFPNWITFCKKCNSAMEDYNSSPIAEPI